MSMSRIGDMDTTCVMDMSRNCDGCMGLDIEECEDQPRMCSMDIMKECDGCWCC